MQENKLIYEALRKADTIVYTSKDEGLREFLSLYYKVIGPGEEYKPETAIFYADKISDIPAKTAAAFCWAREKAADGIHAGNLISGADIKEEYIRLFLGNCSA